MRAAHLPLFAGSRSDRKPGDDRVKKVSATPTVGFPRSILLPRQAGLATPAAI